MGPWEESEATTIGRLRLLLVLLVATMAFGIAGFMLIADFSPVEAFYQTVITLSTVGFREVHKLDTAGQVFTIVLIAMGVSLVLFSVSALGQLLLRGELAELFRRRSMHKHITDMSGHCVVVGYGSVGREVVREIRERGDTFLVIEKEAGKMERLDEESIPFIKGSAIEEPVLHKARVDHARALIATNGSEAENLYIRLTARNLNPDLTIVARAGFEGGERKLQQAGADHVISAHILVGRQIAEAVLKPEAGAGLRSPVLSEDGMEIAKIRLPDRSRLAGQSLGQSRLAEDFKVRTIGISGPGRPLTLDPQPDIRFQDGDILLIAGPSEMLARLEKSLQ